MANFNYNKKLEMICSSKDKYFALVQEYLTKFVEEYPARLSKNYTVYVQLLEKLPIRDALQVKKYMYSYGIEYSVNKEGKKHFKYNACKLEGLWSDFEKIKKAPKPYEFIKALESFINKASKQEVSSSTIEQLKAILEDCKQA